ncbi:hypothetical protein LDK25_03240 [Fusobacterium nucleatum]|uniref:hypothetical protein n=1 Tax=Fusobacterium nucleatum TaxID=851 RepID=UPI0030EE0D0A
MKKIFLILTLFFVFCVNVFASPADFFKSYPNGSIEIDIKWENDELYYNSYFYNANHNKINAKQNWDDFKTNGLLDDIYNILNKNYSNKNMTVSVLLNISPKNKPTMTSKYYNSNNILLKEIIEDKFIVKQKTYDEYGNLISEAEKNEKKNTYHIKTYDKNLKSYAEMEVLFNKNEINFKGNKEDLGYYVSDSYAIESHYTFKKLNQKNLSKILSNLRYYNYEDVVSGYEKIYDNNKPFEYTEKTYKNGKLIDTKEYDDSKNTSKNEVQNSNNSNKIKKVSLNKNDNSSENNSSWYYFIGALVIVIIILGIYRLFKAFPKTKYLSYGQQIRIFQILMKYNENDKELFSAFRVNGIGTGYYSVGSMWIGYDKIYIYAKVFSVFFIPTPIILGYLLCYDEKRILASFSEETFSKAKKEIEETVL